MTLSVGVLDAVVPDQPGVIRSAVAALVAHVEAADSSRDIDFLFRALVHL